MRRSQILGKVTYSHITEPSKFCRLATWAARYSGKPVTFIAAGALIIVWVLTGPYFHYSDTWQLVINTATTIITFLMVFLIQNTQNRDAAAIQIKLDELIRAVEGAHNALLDLESLDQDELDSIRDDYEKLALDARRGLSEGREDTDVPAVKKTKRISTHRDAKKIA